MDKIKCIAIDDEPFALEMISEDIQRIEFLDFKGAYHHPENAKGSILGGDIDLIFLDIQMPTITGIQFLRSLETYPMIILTTAYEQYAIDGFELDVVDYLLKPIPFPRFKQAAERAFNLFNLKKQQQETGPTSQLYVNTQYQKVKIAHDQILYIEGMKDYVKIYVKGQSVPVMTRMNLKKMESELSSTKFCRVHNSFIVSLDKITSSLRSKLFIGTTEIPIGEKFADHFRDEYER